MRWYINHKLRLIEEDNKPLNDKFRTPNTDAEIEIAIMDGVHPNSMADPIRAHRIYDEMVHGHSHVAPQCGTEEGAELRYPGLAPSYSQIEQGYNQMHPSSLDQPCILLYDRDEPQSMMYFAQEKRAPRKLTPVQYVTRVIVTVLKCAAIALAIYLAFFIIAGYGGKP